MKKVLLGSVLILTILISGCGLLESPQATNNDTNGEKIELGYIQWVDVEAQTHILKEILERLDYEVETSVLQAGAVFEGVAGGDIDGYTGVWLPLTHADYWDSVGDQIDKLDPNFHGARIGLVVPEYVDIDSLAELKEEADKFDKEIIGVDPGAGVMQATENEAMAEYGLEDWDLIESSDPARTAELASAIEDEEWIVVTGWIPHWKWQDYDLKFLEDPKNVYGGEETSYTIAREGLADDSPEVAHLFNEFYLEQEQFNKIIRMIEDGMEPQEAAAEFIDNNLDLINSWLADGQEI